MTEFRDPMPIMLLDVDGVLNAPLPEEGGWRTEDTHFGQVVSSLTGASRAMTWSQALIDRLNKMVNEGVAEIRWLSSWCSPGDSENLEQLFGLPHLQRARPTPEHFDISTGSVTRYKHSAVMSMLNSGELENRRLIWVDDRAIPWEGSLHRRLCNRNPGDTLIVEPDSAAGISVRQMQRIEGFCNRTGTWGFGNDQEVPVAAD